METRSPKFLPSPLHRSGLCLILGPCSLYRVKVPCWPVVSCVSGTFSSGFPRFGTLELTANHRGSGMFFITRFLKPKPGMEGGWRCFTASCSSGLGSPYSIKHLAKSLSRTNLNLVYLSASPVTSLAHLLPKVSWCLPAGFSESSYLSPHNKRFDLLTKCKSGRVNLLTFPCVFLLSLEH